MRKSVTDSSDKSLIKVQRCIEKIQGIIDKSIEERIAKLEKSNATVIDKLAIIQLDGHKHFDDLRKMIREDKKNPPKKNAY